MLIKQLISKMTIATLQVKPTLVPHRTTLVRGTAGVFTTAQGTLPEDSTQAAVPGLAGRRGELGAPGGPAPGQPPLTPPSKGLGCIWNASFQDSLWRVKEALRLWLEKS